MKKKRNEIIYFAFRNTKFKIGLGILLFFIILAIIGPVIAKYGPTENAGPPNSPPSAEFWFGTTTFGEDVFSQFVSGLSSTFLVGIVGGGIRNNTGNADRFYCGLPGRYP